MNLLIKNFLNKTLLNLSARLQNTIILLALEIFHASLMKMTGLEMITLGVILEVLQILTLF